MSETPQETLGQRLKRLREAKGMSQYDLAKKADVNVASIKNYEQGLRTPNLEIAAKIADGLGVSLDELAGRKGGGE